MRVPHTAKWCGILPLNFEWVFFLGHMMLVLGYFAAHVLALTVGGWVGLAGLRNPGVHGG